MSDTSTEKKAKVVRRVREELVVAVDAEWDGEKNIPIVVQFACEDGGVGFVFNDLIQTKLTKEEFQHVHKEISEWCAAHQVVLLWAEFSDSSNLLELFLKAIGAKAKNIKFRMFYSAKDLWLGTGFDNLREAFLKGGVSGSSVQGGITQRRCLKGRNIRVGNLNVSVHDLKGWSPTGGLADLASSVGMAMEVDFSPP